MSPLFKRNMSKLMLLKLQLVSFTNWNFSSSTITSKNIISDCSWPHCIQFANMVPHLPFKENEKCSIPSVLWKDSDGNVMLIEHLKCLYRMQHSKSQTDLETSSDCKHLLCISADYCVVLCILVFSSCRFWFIFRIHPSKRNVLSLCTHSGYIQILLGSLYFMSCVFEALWPDVGVTDESRVKESPNTLLLYWWDNYKICLPCNGTWNWQF